MLSAVPPPRPGLPACCNMVWLLQHIDATCVTQLMKHELEPADAMC